MTLEKQEPLQPSIFDQSATPDLPLIQKILSALMALSAIVLLLLAALWFFSDYTNIVEQVPRLQQDLASAVSDGDISSEEFSIVSFGLQQQRFVEGVLAVLLAVVLLLFSLQIVQPKLNQAMLFGLGVASLLLLVLVVRVTDLELLALIIVPIAVAMYLATEIMPFDVPTDLPLVASDAEDLEVDEDNSSSLHDESLSTSVVPEAISDSKEPADVGLVVHESSTEGDENADRASLVVSESEVGKPEAKEKEGDEFEVPEIDELTITGLMNRPSIFENFEGWDDDEDPVEENEVKAPQVASSPVAEGVSSEISQTPRLSEVEDSILESSTADSELKATEDSGHVQSGSVQTDDGENTHAELSAAAPERREEVNPDNIDQALSGIDGPGKKDLSVDSTPTIEPRIQLLGDAEHAAPDEVIQLEHGDLDFEVDGDVVAQLFGNSLDTLMSPVAEDLEAEFAGETEEVASSDIDLTFYDPLAMQEVDAFIKPEFLESLFDDSDVLKTAEKPVLKNLLYDGEDEISDVSDLIDEDLLSATGLFDPDQPLFEDPAAIVRSPGTRKK